MTQGYHYECEGIRVNSSPLNFCGWLATCAEWQNPESSRSSRTLTASSLRDEAASPVK